MVRRPDGPGADTPPGPVREEPTAARPAPGGIRSAAEALAEARRPHLNAASRTLAGTLAQQDPNALARMLLEVLGRRDHPDADANPVYALFQVALDHQCSAEGYRALCDLMRRNQPA